MCHGGGRFVRRHPDSMPVIQHLGFSLGMTASSLSVLDPMALSFSVTRTGGASLAGARRVARNGREVRGTAAAGRVRGGVLDPQAGRCGLHAR